VFALRVAFIALAALAVLAGCSDDDPAKPTPPKEKLDSPAAVLEKLEEAYVQRNVALYDSIIGDGFSGFLFWFCACDVQMGTVPESWARSDELASATALFTSERVTSIDLRLSYGSSYPDTSVGHDGRRIIDVTDVYLTVVDQPPADVEATTYLVQGQRGRFAFDVHWVDAQGDSIWRVVEWWDLGSGAGKAGGKEKTWGNIKNLYHP